MPEHILLMNPRRRRRRHPRRHFVRSHLSHSRSGRVERVRGHEANPRRRRRRHHRRHIVRRMSHHLSGYLHHRRNPRRGGSRGSTSITGQLKGYIMPAAIGAVGGVALDWGWSKLAPHLPTTLQSGWGAFAGQAGTAIVAGWALSKALPRQRHAVAAGVVGALVIVTYNAILPLIAAKLGISGLQDYQAYRIGAYQPGVGPARVALPAPGSRMGLISPAAGVQNVAGAIRGTMGPGIGGIAGGFGGYMPES